MTIVITPAKNRSTPSVTSLTRAPLIEWLRAELLVAPVGAIVAWIVFRYFGGLASTLISSVFVTSATLSLIAKGAIARQTILKWVPLLLFLSGLSLAQAAYVASLLENVDTSGIPLVRLLRSSVCTKCER